MQMENNSPQADLLLINEPLKNVNIPFGLGIASTSLLLLSFLSEFILSFGIGFIFFITSFILSIMGLVLVTKYKKQGLGYGHQALTKLKSAKWLSIFTLTLTSLVILGAISLLILIGNGGFGR
jgi:hypothetical protein